MVKEMRKIAISPGELGAIYYENVSITSGVSATYKIPVSSIYAIGVNVDNGTLYFTIDSYSKIDNETANYVAWDGTSKINLAVTGWYLEHTLDTATAEVTIKTNRI